jgi:ribosome-binding protein aMBF1 (putative translation factor)
VRLLEDIGFDPDDSREDFELTMPRQELTALLDRLREEAEIVAESRLDKAMEDETDRRFRVSECLRGCAREAGRGAMSLRRSRARSSHLDSPERLTFAKRFGVNVAHRRRAAGISQEMLGDLAAFHRTTVGQLERGERVARAGTLVKLAAALGIDANVLLEGIVWTPLRLDTGSFGFEPLHDDQGLRVPGRRVMAGYEYNPHLARCFGEKILVARRRAGFSREELASIAALHRTEIGQIGAGNPPRPDRHCDQASGSP